jgi:predicted NBD/HSP70 family sugar kinase
MIGAIDIGGTKTLVAVFTTSGKLVEQQRVPTNKDYEEFLFDLRGVVASLTTKEWSAAGVAIPGRLDRKNGRALGYGTLPWGQEAVEADIEKIVRCPVVIENDAKLAGLSEALQLKAKYHDVLYVTLGTGISCALITNGVIDAAMADSEGGQILVDFRGKAIQWEDVVSGRAIVERFAKRASDIDDEKTWKVIAHDIALGLINLIAVTQPDVIVMGGGVNTNFPKYGKLLRQELKKYATPLVPIPPVVQAKRPEEAVIYGCFELARMQYGRAHK